MKLNNFIWNNYKQTPQGKETIDLFTEGNSTKMLSKFAPLFRLEIEIAASLIDDLLDFCTSPKFPETLSMEHAVELYKEIVQNGFTLTYEDGVTKKYGPNNFDF